MKLNELSFTTEKIKIDDFEYLAFYYFIDGENFSVPNFLPVSANEVDDEYIENQEIVVLQIGKSCECEWEEDSIVADVIKVSHNVIRWNVRNYSNSKEKSFKTYFFEKSQYEKVIDEMKRIAQKENYCITVRLEPDEDNCFWLEKDIFNKEKEGECLGNAKSILIFGKKIELNIPGLEEWILLHKTKLQHPLKNDEVTLEELRDSFDWKSFNREGCRLVEEISRFLPERVAIGYCGVFEDITKIPPQEHWIY